MKAEIKQAFVKTLSDKYPGRSVFDRDELINHANEMGMPFPGFCMKSENRVDRGKYQIQMLSLVSGNAKRVEPVEVENSENKLVQTVFEQVKIEVPNKDKMYVSWGFFRDFIIIRPIHRRDDVVNVNKLYRSHHYSISFQLLFRKSSRVVNVRESSSHSLSSKSVR